MTNENLKDQCYAEARTLLGQSIPNYAVEILAGRIHAIRILEKEVERLQQVVTGIERTDLKKPWDKFSAAVITYGVKNSCEYFNKSDEFKEKLEKRLRELYPQLH